MDILVAVFWTAVGVVGLTYVVMPALVLGRGLVVHREVSAGARQPTVSVIVAAYNEVGVIASKIRNLLALDYPVERRELIVVSDGSVDGTEHAVAAFADAGVRAIALPRVGKAMALNTGVAASTGDVLVFTDANSMLVPNALRALMAPLADPRVGAVAGDQRYGDTAGAAGITESERRYWNLDRALKRAESRAGSAVSATGALYAIRRELFEIIPDGVTDDFFSSTAAICAGRRLVFAEDAAAYEPVAVSGGREFGRKVRIMTRGLRAVHLRRELLNPRRHGFYAVQLLWHKVLRRLVALPLLVVAVVAPLLWSQGKLYQLATVAQGAFYALAVLGLRSPGARGKISALLHLPTYFCLVNLAALLAAWNVVRGRRIDRWETSGSQPAAEPPLPP